MKKVPEKKDLEEKVVEFKVIEGGRIATDQGGPIVTNWLKSLEEGTVFWAGHTKYSDSWYIAQKFQVYRHYDGVTELRCFDVLQHTEGLLLAVIPDRFCQSYKLLEVIGVLRKISNDDY